MKIPFNKAPVTGSELKYISQAIDSHRLCGDNFFGIECQKWFTNKFGPLKSLMTPSCTHALELAALLANIQPDDEVIMPSYTFVSTANAFVLRGAKIVFVDIRKDTLNLDETKIESAITDKTKCIVPVHYAGISCEMDTIMNIAAKYNLLVIEDAAQGVMSKYKGKYLGTIGHLGAFSFHETKNYTSGGEGGLLLINNEKLINRAEILREKGTNRSQFFRGMVDKYSWVDIGSSYLPSELQSAYLWGQLESAEMINEYRLYLWNNYYQLLAPLQLAGKIDLPVIPEECQHNAHMFYIKVKNLLEREKLIKHLKNQGILAVFHYVPLHSAKFGLIKGRFDGNDTYTTSESERLLRLPIFYNMQQDELLEVVKAIKSFYKL